MEANGYLFDFPKLEITNKIRLIELFGGIGSQAMALRDIGADFEHYRLVEFDKYAVASYNAIHGTNFSTTDIREVHGPDLGITEKDKYTYIMTYSFPCTDLSVAGQMKGMSKKEWENGKSTRSGLLWEVERILKECDELPQVLLMENVPQIHAEPNKEDFESWLAFLRSKGYYNHYSDLNAKDYEVPQNRDRTFCVSILAKEYIEYEWPEKKPLNKVMKDYLEGNVEEKYYIKNDKADQLIQNLIQNKAVEQPKNTIEKIYLGNYYGRHDGYDGSVFHPNGLCKTITHSVGGVADIIEKDEQQIKTIDLSLKNPQERIIANCITALYNQHGISNHAQEGNGVIEIKQATKEGTIKCKVGGCFDSSFPDSKTRRGRVQNEGDVTPTLTASNSESIVHLEPQTNGYRIRKLTPKECWRLMGYTDEDYDRAQKVNSNTQLYKQAGNAIVKQVLMAIFAQMIPSVKRL